MIRKLIKRLGILLGVIVLLPVLLALVGAVLLPKDRIQQDVSERLAAATGAQVSLGKPSIGLWPGLKVHIDGGSIIGTGPDLARATGSANNLDGYRVDLGSFDLQVELKPLLRREIQVGSVKVTGPVLQVAWDKGEVLAEDFQMEITDLVMPVEETQPEGEAPGDLIPEDLILNFSGSVQRLTLQKAIYEQVEFKGDLDTRILTLESIIARRSSGSITASGEIDYERDPCGELDFAAEAVAVPAVALLEPWVPDLASRLTGDLQAEVSGKCSLKDEATTLASLSLTGELSCGEGVLAAADWLSEVSPYLGDRQDLKNIRFSALEHSFRIDEGRYLLEDLQIVGHDTDWRGSGWIGLDGTMDTTLQVKLPAGFTPELGQWSFLADTLRDEEGRVNLDLHLTGNTEKPRVGLNLGSLQGGTGQNTAETVKKGLGGLLDKWKTR
jgi:hypothetical protein